MLEQINETVDVVTLFKQNKTVPWKFLWQGKEFVISKVNLTYSTWEGRSKIYYFAVSDNCNYFKLRFNTDSLCWTLLESYVD